jgi:hypothetical protein
MKVAHFVELFFHTHVAVAVAENSLVDFFEFVVIGDW